jgi:hypothetical protein
MILDVLGTLLVDVISLLRGIRDDTSRINLQMQDQPPPPAALGISWRLACPLRCTVGGD